MDADTSPAFQAKYDEQVAIETQEYLTVTLPERAAEPNRTYNATLPATKVTDPFRSPEEWAANGRGRHLKFSFINNGGAKLRARLLAPLDESQTYPALTFTPGLQSFNEVNAWFPQEMAEAGYVVLIIDPQAQGDSELCGHEPDGTQTDCPATNQPDDTRSAIDFVLSTPGDPYPWALGPNADGTPTFNPFWEAVDHSLPVGIAGHSLGAIAVTPIGQADLRVGAVVSYDNLDGGVGSGPRRTPSLFFHSDYPFPVTPTPMTSNPSDPDQHMDAFGQLTEAGVDVMSITSRASDHYEWGYQPFPLNFPSSRWGERIALYFSLAWFDRYLKGDPSGTTRLVRGYFDDTPDRHSIGAGTYDPVQAAADPTNPFAGNVPYTIEGKCVANLLSFYYHSAYSLEGGTLVSNDMRALGCDDLDADGMLDAVDNCPNLANEDQLDRGGINTTEPDGIGDACQCGDVTGNGVVNGQDGNAIRRHGLGVEPNPLFAVPGNCDVTGNGLCNGQDGNAVRSVAIGVDTPTFGQNCHNAVGTPVPPDL